MSKGQRLRDAHTNKILNYGHLGTLNYNEATTEWETARIIQSDDPCSDLSNHTTTISAFPFRHVSSRLLLSGSSSEPVEEEYEGSASPVASHDATAPTIPIGHYQDGLRRTIPPNDGGLPNAEECLAIGGALVIDNRSTAQSSRGSYPVTPIWAAVESLTSHLLCMFSLNPTVQQADSSPQQENLQAEWKSPGGPIQQICFAATIGYPSTWMAVRLLSTTVILHPLVCTGMHANRVISIPVSRTGGASHADVAILSRDNIKVAIIDIRGSWSVWQSEGADKDCLAPKIIISLVSYGSLTAPKPEVSIALSPPYGEWHRIRWIMNSQDQTEALFACSRQKADFLGASGAWQKPINMYLKDPERGRMVLDVKKSEKRPDLFFVLTSDSLVAISLDASEGAGEGEKGNDHILLLWRHFRSQRDVALRLGLVETSLGTTCLVTSKASDVILAFQFKDHPSMPGMLVSQSDPCCLQLPKFSQIGRRPRLLCFQTATRTGSDNARRNSTNEQPDWILLALYDDSSVSEYGYKSLQADAPLSLLDQVPRHVKLSNEMRDVLDNRRKVLKWEAKRKRKTTSTRDWQEVYSLLIAGEDGFAEEARSRFTGLLADKGDEIRQQGASRMLLLSENSTSRLLTRHIDKDSDRLEVFLSSMESEDTILMSLLRPYSRESKTPTLNLVYEAINAAHPHSLLPELSGEARTHRKRLARRVAADVYLASWAVCPAIPEANDAVMGGSEPEDAELMKSSLPSHPASSFPVESSPQMLAAGEDPVMTCLKRYAILSSRSSTPDSHISSIPELHQILRHLPESAASNPAHYSWSIIEQSLATEEEEKLALELAEKDPRAARKAEKAKLARTKREAARREQEEVMASQHRPPTVVSSSQVPNYGSAMPDRSLVSQSGQTVGPRWSSQMESSQPQSTLRLSQSQETGQALSARKPKAKKRTAGF